MLSAAAAGAFDVVVAWHVDRLVRRLADLEPVLAAFQRSGISIATVTGELDPATDVGRLVARILSSVAQAEVERKGARQRRANLQRAEQGHVRLVRRPFGYDLEGRIVRREANALRWAAAGYVAGRSAASLARELNSRGVRTSTGATWRGPSLLKVLTNARYAGIVTYHGVPVAEAHWRPILADAVHRDVVRLASDPGRRIPQNPARRHLLTGIARCGLCDTRLESNSDGRTGRRIYRCPRLHLSRQMDAVDDLVVAATLQTVAAIGSRNVEDAGAGTEDLASLRQARRSRARTQEAARLFGEGLIDRDQLLAITRAGRLRVVELEQQYANRTRQHALAHLLGSMTVVRTSRSLRQRWDRLTVEQRREVVSSLLTVRILPCGPGHGIQPDRIEIRARP